MIVAMTSKSGIGMSGSIPWCYREDLRRFRYITLGCPLIMGRKTWESLPKKPLPGRVHIVVTRNLSYTVDHPMVRVVHSREEALRAAEDAILADTESENNPSGWVWVIGGEEIYKMFSHHRYLKRIEITQIPDDIECDKFFIPFPLWFQKTKCKLSNTVRGMCYVTYESRGADDEIVRMRSFT
jgi:dihydrofolate reductase